MFRGEMQSANLRTCLLIRGWTYVVPSDDERHRIRGLSEPDRDRELDRLIGTADLSPAVRVSIRNDWAAPEFSGSNDETLEAYRNGYNKRPKSDRRVAAPLPTSLPAGLSTITVGFRRPNWIAEMSEGGVVLAPYDLKKRALIGSPYAKNSSWIRVESDPGPVALEYITTVLSPGDYVLFSTSLHSVEGYAAIDFCMGTPLIHVQADQTLYFGDLTPSVGMTVGNRWVLSAAYSSNLAEARDDLIRVSNLARTLVEAPMENGAVYPCTGLPIGHYMVPGR
jgi:hypothetical protein